MHHDHYDQEDEDEEEEQDEEEVYGTLLPLRVLVLVGGIQEACVRTGSAATRRWPVGRGPRVASRLRDVYGRTGRAAKPPTRLSPELAHQPSPSPCSVRMLTFPSNLATCRVFLVSQHRN